MHPFVPGQRWLSETQGDLGLGQVLGVDERCVHIGFPATGETRLYTLRSAPLVRVELDPGERIRDRAGRALTVRAREELGGLIAYRCEDSRGGRRHIPETDLDTACTLTGRGSDSFPAGSTRTLGSPLRYPTRFAGEWEASSPVRGLVGARVELIPHQLYIAAEVARRDAPRVLLADEVGLGKTIEAGLILHRMLLTGRASRVLILVPEPLLHQWLVEMRRRFNLRLALFDRERLAAMDGGEDAEAENPFQTEQCVLCSLDLLTEDPNVARGALAGVWDLFVVDEAHHLAWVPEDGVGCPTATPPWSGARA